MIECTSRTPAPDAAPEAAREPTLPVPRGARFERALAMHRELHASELPLVVADLRHAHDTRRWVLHLEGEASEALELAALFHDVERLFSETEVRVEQHAPDYQAFKDAHAARGAQIASQLLALSGYDAVTRHRVAALVARHERPPASGDDPELATLRDADALSFVALNFEGFLDYFGPEHTRRKLVWTWDRMSPRARAIALALPLRPDLRALVADLGGTADHG